MQFSLISNFVGDNMADAYDFYNVNFISADGSIKSIVILAHNLSKMNFFSALIDEGEQQFDCLFVQMDANNITILNNEYLNYDSFMLLLNFLVHGSNSYYMNSPYALRAFKEAANFCQAEGVLEIFINQEKRNIKAAQFINAHYPAQLIYDAYKDQLNVECLISEFLKYPCYSESLICGLGYTAMQLRRNNICLDAVVQANCFSHKEVISAYGAIDAIAFINAGISLNALAKHGHEGYGLKDTQYTARELKEIGFNAKQLKTAGFTAMELKVALFTAKDLKEAGFSDWALKAVHFTAVELKKAGLQAWQLRMLGFTAKEIKAEDFDLAQLIADSFSTKDLINMNFNIGHLTSAYLRYFKSVKPNLTTIEQMIVFEQFHDHHVVDMMQRAQHYDQLISIESLSFLGFREEYIINNTIKVKAEITHSLSSLDDYDYFYHSNFDGYCECNYYDVREVLAIFFKNNGVSAKDLKEAGFSVTHLKVAEFTLNEIITAGYTLKEIRQSHQYSDAKITKEANTISGQSHQPELSSQLREMRHANDCCSAM